MHRELRRPIRRVVEEIRASPRADRPTPTTLQDLAIAQASTSAALVHFLPRIADALEGIDASLVLLFRTRSARGAPWWAFGAALAVIVAQGAVLLFVLRPW